MEARTKLRQLDIKIQELDALVERGKQLTIVAEQEVRVAVHLYQIARIFFLKFALCPSRQKTHDLGNVYFTSPIHVCGNNTK